MRLKVLADMEHDDVVTVTKVRKTRINIPAYDCIGGNMEYQTKVKGFNDLYSIIQNMSKQTAWLWWQLVKSRNRYTNEAFYIARSLVDKRRLTVAYKELHKLNLIRRMSKQQYIINPLAYIPEHDQFPIVSEKWNSIVQKEK